MPHEPQLKKHVNRICLLKITDTKRRRKEMKKLICMMLTLCLMAGCTILPAMAEETADYICEEENFKTRIPLNAIPKISKKVFPRYASACTSSFCTTDII